MLEKILFQCDIMSGSALKRADRQSGVRWKKPAEPRKSGQEVFQEQREKLGEEIRSLLHEIEEAKKGCRSREVESIVSETLASAKWERFKAEPEKKIA